MHVPVVGFVFSKSGDGEVDGDEAAQGILVVVGGFGGGASSAEEEFADAGFYAVAADYWIVR